MRKRNLKFSARAKLTQKLNSSSRVDDLIVSAQRKIRECPETAYHLFNEALSIAVALRDEMRIAECLRGKCKASFYLADYKTALQMAQEAEKKFANLEKVSKVAELNSDMGSIYFRVGNYEHALTKYLTTLKLADSIGDLKMVGVALNHLAVVYAETGDLNNALLYQEKSLRVKQSLNDREGESASLNNLAGILICLGKYKKAAQTLSQSFKLLQTVGDKNAEATICNLLGVCFEKQGKHEMALARYKRSLELFESLNDRSGIAVAALNYGTLARKKGEYETASAHLHLALQNAEQCASKQYQYESHIGLSELYEATGDLKKAIFHFKSYHALYDEVKGAEALQKVKRLQVLLETQRLEKEKEIYRLQSERLEMEIRHKNRELELLSLKLIERVERIDELKRLMKKKADGYDEELKNAMKKIDVEQDWKTFESQFSAVHHQFIESLSATFPKLTPTELRLCALLKMQLSTKDIARLLHTTLRNVENHRFRIRKKLRLNPADNLSAFLTAFKP